MSRYLTETLTKRIKEILLSKGIDDPEGLALRILRSIYDELFVWLDQNGVNTQPKEIEEMG